MPTAAPTPEVVATSDLATGLGLSTDDITTTTTTTETYETPAFTEPQEEDYGGGYYGGGYYDDYGGGGFATRRRLTSRRLSTVATTTVATTTVTSTQPAGGCAAVYAIAEDPESTLFAGSTSFDGSSVTCRETLESTMSTTDQPKASCPGQIILADGRADWCNGHGACDRASGVCVCDCSAGVCYADGDCGCPEGLVADPSNPGSCRIAEDLITARATAAGGTLPTASEVATAIIPNPNGTPSAAPTPNPTTANQEFIYFNLQVTLGNIHTRIFGEPETNPQFRKAVAFAITTILADKEASGDRRSLAEIIVHARKLAAYIVSFSDVEMISYGPDENNDVVVTFRVKLPKEDADYITAGIRSETLSAVFNSAVKSKLQEQSADWSAVEPSAIVTSASVSDIPTTTDANNGGGASSAIIGVLVAIALVVGLLLAVRHHKLREAAGANTSKDVGMDDRVMTRVTSMSTDVVISQNRQVRSGSGFEQANPMAQGRV